LIGRLILTIPRMLALSAVQRQAAASRSAKPWMSEQHGFTGGFPNVRSTRLSTLAQVLICIGQVPVVAEVQVKKRRLRETKSAREVLGAICLYSTKDQEVVVYIICLFGRCFLGSESEPGCEPA
jgi:hypothetical protein